MMRKLTVLSISLLAIGCHAPVPSMDVFAPYGSPTVPPPATGTVGTSGTYYAPTTPTSQTLGAVPGQIAPGRLNAGGQAAAGTQPLPGTQPTPGAPPTTFMGAAATGGNTGATFPVAPASFQPGTVAGTSLPQPLPGTGAAATTAVGHGSSSSSSTLKLNGMRVNDATGLTEPQQITPSNPVNITSLPPANPSRAPSFMRFLNPKPAATAGVPTPATPVPGTTPPATGTWQGR